MKKSLIKNISLGIACLLGVGGSIAIASAFSVDKLFYVANAAEPSPSASLSGNGTLQSPYQIGSPSDLVKFRNLVNGGNPNICGELTNDIKFTGTNNWATSIGTSNFGGTFDGLNHTISGLNQTTGNPVGCLFRNVHSGTIKNVTVKDCTISTSSDNCLFLGGIAAYLGYAYSSTPQIGRIENCHTINVNLSSTYDYCVAGGIVGNMDVADSVIDRCTNTGTGMIDVGSTAGGIVGSTSGGTLTNCYNFGTVSSKDDTPNLGGIVGQITSKGVFTMNNCYNYGSLVVQSGGTTWVGGIVGMGNGSTIANVSNNYYLNTLATKGVGSSSPVAEGIADALTAEQFKVRTNFKNWPFGTIWMMDTNYPILGSKVVEITLDNQGADTGGTTTIYEKKSGNFYLDENCTNQITSSSGIIIPTLEQYNFLGYYTETEGNGLQFIDENGHISDTADSDFFSTSGTLYAAWEIAGPQPATIDNIEDANLTYGYASASLTINASVTEVGTTLTYQWYSNTTKTNTDGTLIQGATSATYNIPTGKDVGSYYYYCLVTSHNDGYGTLVTNKASNAVEVAVGKATPVLTAPTAKTGLGYNGSAQVLVNAGSTTGGTVLYKVGAGEYSSELPKATEIGTYVVSYKVDGGTNYTDIAEDSLEVTIGKGSINPVVTISDWTFNETASTPSTSGNPGSGEVTYQYKVKGADDSTYSIVVPTTVGEYTVKATVSETTNYLGGTATADFKIAQATPTGYDIPTGLNATYGDTLSSVELPDTWAWKNPNDKVGNAGNREHIAIYTPADPNYKAVENNLTVAVSKANPSVPTLDTIEAPYDVALSTLGLPEGFSWMDGTQKTSAWGENTFKVKYTPADQANYNVIENIDVKVNVKWILVDPTQGDVNVTINGDTGEFTVDISIKVEVKTEISMEEKKTEYANIGKEYVKPNEDITAIYDVKLIRTTNGVEEEIQPSQIKEGTTIFVQMAIPEELVGKEFRLLHIHNDNDVSVVENYAVSKDGKTLVVEVDKLSQFAFLGATDKDNGFDYSIGLPGWALTLIIVGAILLLGILALLILFFICNKWIIVDNKAVRVFVYNKKNNEENKLLTLTLKKYVRKEEEIYKNRQDALNALNK